jgi:hypothetical protein
VSFDPPAERLSFSDSIPAFPGAEGWGATALTRCRSRPMRVLTVTNTRSTGPGSLDAALNSISDDRFNFILFRTGGRIVTPPGENLRLRSGCVYIAGQTAPGGGIAIEGRGAAFWFRGPVEITDVVMRYLRFRGRSGLTSDNLIIARGERIVLDHLSLSWADNYVLALLRYGERDWSGPIRDVSLQNSIVAEAFAAHPTGLHIASNEVLRFAPTIGLTNLSLHRNLMANNSHRNPNTGADNILLANNVIYNWNQGALQMQLRGLADFVNNYGKAGPMTHPRYRYLVNPNCDPAANAVDFSIYAAGNVGPMSADADGDNWTGSTRQVACYYDTAGEPGHEVPSRWRRDTPQPWASIPFPVRLLPAPTAFDAVLNDVGANASLACDGSWRPASDPVDRRIIREARTGTGPADPPVDETALGGYPDYSSGVPCPDDDQDGLPNDWEQRFFACATCAEPAAIASNGYLVIEHYLNGTDPR